MGPHGLLWGTKNVTRSIEDQGIAVTVEGASLAVAAGVWPKVNPDPVVHTPWGTTKRPQIYDTSQTVTLQTLAEPQLLEDVDELDALLLAVRPRPLQLRPQLLKLSVDAALIRPVLWSL